MTPDPRPSAVVVGAGISGLTAAYVLRHSHRVTLLEADDRLGGHADTHDIPLPDGSTVPVDSGFIVHNERTYPVLLRIFAELGVATQDSEMSMSISCQGCGLSFAGGKGLAGLLAQPGRLRDRDFRRLLAQVPRFHRAGRRELARAAQGPRSDGVDDPADGLTLGEFLEREGFDDHFVRHYAIPLVSCVWSSGHGAALGYPVRHLLRFLDHHGMLRLGGSPTWKTVTGGSQVYVESLAGALHDAGTVITTAAPVTGVRRTDDGVSVTWQESGQERGASFDVAVLATHADVAARVLRDADPQEAADLAAFAYSRNPTVLHTDSSVLPAQPRARASWNYRLTDCDQADETVLVSYWMNNLHRLDAATDLVVTLNPDGQVDPGRVLVERDYAHPAFTPAAVAGAARLRSAGGPRLSFAGAHLGWGFHEDGARSGVDAARRLGGMW